MSTNHVCNQKNVDLDGNPLTLYDNNAQICNGTFTKLNYNKTHPSFTAGINYELANNMSVYGRVSYGGHFDDFDNGIRGSGGNFAPMQKIHNFEGGFKYQADWIFLDLSAYHRQFTGLQYSYTDNANVPLGCNSQPATSTNPQCTSLYGADSKGMNMTAVFSFDAFKFNTLVAWQDGHYSHENGFITVTDVNGHPLSVDFNGQPLQRQPKLRYMLTPSYDFRFDWGDILPFVTYTHNGNRFEDQTGLAPLGAYNTWDFGVVANYGKNWQFRVQGTNLSNEIGLTEGNARVAGIPADRAACCSRVRSKAAKSTSR